MLDTVRYQNFDCVPLSNNTLTLLVTHSVGPRIISLRLGDHENLLAQVPHRTAECPGAGTFHFHGGHRLWHAPEVISRTYLPDDAPVDIVLIEDGLLVTQPTEAQTGLQKSLRIRLGAERAAVVIDHTLTNQGQWPVTCAPWAITQLKPGGVGILPQQARPLDPSGLQPNRSIALWPYADVASPFIHWGNRFIRVTATMKRGALKIGFPNPLNWLAYHRGDTLFVKKAMFQLQAGYFDMNSSSQCYCDQDFLELETLGPRTAIAPGASTTHREVWELHRPIALGETEDDIQELADRLNLTDNSLLLGRQ